MIKTLLKYTSYWARDNQKGYSPFHNKLIIVQITNCLAPRIFRENLDLTFLIWNYHRILNYLYIVISRNKTYKSFSDHGSTCEESAQSALPQGIYM